nr:helix-turn-helix transcriptional regulator [Nonomuraea typhae]
MTPRQVGLPAGSRKVTGLRREEVAHRAGISVDYYTRLEQGRLPAPSGGVLDALAHALLLNLDQRDYLRSLADRAPARRQRPRQQSVPEPVLEFLNDLTATPAFVLGRFLDVLAWNDLTTELFTDFGALAEPERNYLRMVFLDPLMRERLPDWDSGARQCVSVLRMDAARYPSDPRLAALVAELAVKAPEFHHWWTTHRVAAKTFGVKSVHHPKTGTLHLHWQILTVAQDPDQCLVVLPPADEESRAGLALLNRP